MGEASAPTRMRAHARIRSRPHARDSTIRIEFLHVPGDALFEHAHDKFRIQFEIWGQALLKFRSLISPP
jgi:hypothetical protein